MKIGLDFDRVLFDTDSFNEYMKDETGLHHVETDVYDNKGNYSPERHAEASDIDAENVYDAIKDLERFIYDDVDLLRNLDDHTLVIVTRGEEKYQRAKVEASGVKDIFAEVYVVQEGSKDVDGVEFLVDDREEEIHRAGIPGLVLDRDEHGMEHVVKFAGGEK
jgi:FMN phosphatase YigB (HAD superfamily)